MTQVVTLVGDKQFLKKISGLINKAQNPVRAMEAISNMMRNDVFLHFKEEKSEDGKWPALKPATIKWKQERGYRGMLKNTGRLRGANLPSHTSKQAIVSNDLEYASTQNDGDKDRNIPSRNFMWLSKAAMKNIVNKMLFFLKEGI